MPKFIDDLVLRFAWADAKRTFGLVRAITTPTRRAADFLERTVEVTGVIPVSCGIDRTQYTPVIAPRDKNRIIFVGRLTAEKQVEVILEAMTKLDPALEATFDIVGGGDQRKQLENLATQLGIADRVTFHGRTTDEQRRAAVEGDLSLIHI